MQIGPHVEALQRDFASIANVADPQAGETFQRIAGALEASIRLRIIEAVTESAHELTPQLPSGHIEVRLEGGDPALAYVGEAPEPAPAVGAEDAFTARITLRLPEALKASVDAAAAQEGMSVNAWLVQAISRELSPQRQPWGASRPPGKGRLTGFAKS
jgi:predicted HicB family RNase H-like nuclease